MKLCNSLFRSILGPLTLSSPRIRPYLFLLIQFTGKIPTWLGWRWRDRIGYESKPVQSKLLIVLRLCFRRIETSRNTINYIPGCLQPRAIIPQAQWCLISTACKLRCSRAACRLGYGQSHNHFLDLSRFFRQNVLGLLNGVLQSAFAREILISDRGRLKLIVQIWIS